MTHQPGTGLPLLIAHRGASHAAPENTLAAFERAWTEQADGIEGDFRLTADGRIVCLHDASLQRTAGVEQDVASMTLAQVRAADAGAWKGPQFAGQRVPTLEEVLAAVPEGKRLLLEIKSGPEILPELHRVLTASRTSLCDCRLITFHTDVIVAARRMLPQLQAYWLTSFKPDQTTGQLRPMVEEVLTTLRQTGSAGVDARADVAALTPDFVRALRQAGQEIHVWTVDDAPLARQMMELGVDSITTDRPAHLRQTLAPDVAD